ncbi:MAG: lysoplasmalogenase [Flavobacteriaceae bacterium]|nr:MAG: lysoplasmalogenase [Flavobacteriaceae bacterium]
MKQKQFSIIFGIILLTELSASIFTRLEPMRFFTKPAITISLILFLTTRKEVSTRTKKFLILGLLFSLMGDILLMFTSHGELYFMAGLFSFLLAHVMYITAFYIKGMLKNKAILPFLIALCTYAATALYFIGPKLGGLMPYVVAYIFVILILGLVALLRKHITNNLSYLLLLIGALCFIASDTLLAFNKFYQHFSVSAVLIMLTYGLAQVLIVYAGIAENKK